MRKTTFFRILLVLIIISTASLNAWADTYTYTFTTKAWSAYDSQILSSVSWTAAATGGAYWGYDATKGQQFGSSSNPATALSMTTAGISGTISSVKVNTSGASSVAGTISVSVGDISFVSGNTTLTATATDYVFTGAGSGNLVISWTQTSSKALYIKSIEITYATTATTAPVITPASPAGTVGSPFSFTISATNTPTSYALSSGTLPAGLSLNTTSGAIIGTPTAVGSPSVTVTATNATGTSTPATLSFSIAKGNQTITFGALDTKTNSDVPFDLTATASSGQTVSYTSSNTNIATVVGSTATIKSVGTTTITASQAGNDNYNAATSVNQDLIVSQYVTPTITITEITVLSFTASLGNSDNQSLNVSGVNLTGDVTLALSGTNADQFTLSQTTVTQSGGIAPNTVLSTTYTPTTTGTHIATLTLSSVGATSVTQSLTGTCGLEIPVATAATNVSNSGFTANWNALSGATEYQLSVYSKTNSTSIKVTEGFDAAPTAATDWTFTTIATTYTSSGNYGASSPSIKFDATGDALTTPMLPAPATEMSFWIKGQTSTGSALLVEGFNGTAWVTIENIVSPSNTAKTYLYSSTSTPVLPTGITRFRYTYNKVTSNLAFDDVSYTYGGSSSTTLAGSPFTVTGTISKTFIDLSSATEYYYNLTAKIRNQTTVSSNEIHVITLPTGLSNIYNSLNINAAKGILRFGATAGEIVEIFNAIGQKILSKSTIEGTNTIQINTHGVILVKVGNRLGKVIL